MSVEYDKKELRDSIVDRLYFYFNKSWVYSMGRARKSIQYLFLLLITFLLASACSGTDMIVEAPSEAVCNSIIDARCVRCHYKTRICDALGTKSVSKWKKTIKFMIKQGAELTEDEQNKVIMCLSSLPEGSDVVCQ